MQLHVIHDLGGGSGQWVRDFGGADSSRENLVLRALSQGPEMATGLGLYESVGDEVPAKAWQLSRPISAAVASHPEYRAILGEILDERGVDVLLVSSLIGQSLDLLDTDRRTILVAHDYFPYCPAINLHFGEVCRDCDDAKIERCERDNEAFNPFVDFPASERSALREKYMELVRRPNVTLAVPSDSVQQNLTRLDPRFREASFATIPHGHSHILPRLSVADPSAHGRLRVLVLGQLSVAKGLHLLREALPAITEFADVYLLGCGELGELFKYQKHVQVVSQYRMDELAIHVGHINPHVGLLASIVPETFGYTLSELIMLGVPVAATRVGSFAERIRHGETGYLFDPDAASLLAALREIDEGRALLAKIRRNVRALEARTAADMVADYHRIAPIASARTPTDRPRAPDAGSGARDGVFAAQAATLASMWKDVKSLNIHLTALVDARQRDEGERRRLEIERDTLARRLDNAAAKMGDHARQLDEKEKERGVMATQLEVRTAQLAEILSSTSWRVSAPVRWLASPTGKRCPRGRR